MDNLYIFGDSYATPETNSRFPYAWTNRLAENYNTKNFAWSGTGPDWSLDLFLKEIENLNPDKNNYCIFCISNIFRLNIKGIKHTEQSTISNYVNWIRWPKIKLPKWLKKDTKKYENLRPYFDFLFESYFFHSTFHRTELIKIILFLKFHADKFKKLVVLLCFDNISYDWQQKLNSKNFYISTQSLISKFPYPAATNIANHMMEPEHIILYDYVLKKLQED